MRLRSASSADVRQGFLDYFQQQGHLVMPSSPLVPRGDPTLLLTNAGMVQMKPFFMGEATPPRARLTSAQKCFRTTDIDIVGNERNLTFFEMLGNFSVGDYFKREAIRFGWEFSIEWMGLNPSRIWVTVYPDDDEALAIWRDEMSIPVERIAKAEENWWGPAGNAGPCGPDTELYYDRGESKGCGRATCAPGCDCARFLEFWNLVFMQYYQDEAGQRTLLLRKNIDTGMGLERAAMLLQGVDSVYETDLFRPILQRAEELAGRRYGDDPSVDFSLRVIADHSRAITFLIADGVLPGNEGRSYILRRVLRRAVRHGRLLGIERPFLTETAHVVVQMLGGIYPEMQERQGFLEKVVATEEAKFQQTLTVGLALLDKLITEADARREHVIAGEEAFRLYDTYGFPSELTVEVARERGMTVDRAGFEAAMERQRELARASHKFIYVPADTIALPTEETRFLGYTALTGETAVLALLREGQLVEVADGGQEVEVILRETPFYAESGGQVGDTGTIECERGRLRVRDTVYLFGRTIAHRCIVEEGYVQVGDIVRCKVDEQRRWDVARNHTATHLLQRALRAIVGPHVIQSGSLVAPSRLRFDFSHLAPLTDQEFNAVLGEVNARVREDLAVQTSLTSYQEAMAAGAIALFGEKYGDRVRLVDIGGYSLELCGGTHLHASGQIGYFHLISEASIGSGLRRVEAVTGRGAEEYLESRLGILERVAAKLGGGDVETKIDQLQAELQSYRKQLEELQRVERQKETEALLARVQEVDGIRLIAAQVDAPSLAAMREMGDLLRAHLGSGVVVLGATIDQKPAFVAMGTADLGIHAGQLIKQVAAVVGGSGGGTQTVAQGGGGDPSRLSQALEQAASFLRRRV